MAKYRFRLATLQKIRESHRDEMRSRLGEAQKAESMLAEQMDTIRTESADTLQTHRGLLQSNTANMNSLLDMQRYQAVLRGQLTTLADQSKLITAEIEKRRQALIEADQQVRVLEKLHERQLEAHRREQQVAEIKVLDEIASLAREVDY